MVNYSPVNEFKTVLLFQIFFNPFESQTGSLMKNLIKMHLKYRQYFKLYLFIHKCYGDEFC